LKKGARGPPGAKNLVEGRVFERRQEGRKNEKETLANAD